MNNALRRLVLVSVSLAFPVTAFASASSVSEALGNPAGNAPVTRATFLKAAVITLGVPVDFGHAGPDDVTLPYLKAAEERHALDALEADADLYGPITRGEAIRLVAELREWHGSGAVAQFDDVPSGAELRAAVVLSVQHGWMKPLRGKTFGVASNLRSKEAVSVLTRASADAGERPAQAKIVVSSKKKTVVGFESKKFRDQVMSLLRDDYLYPEKLRAATGSTAAAYVESIKDPYTALFSPVEAKAFQDQLSGEVTGIGVQIDDAHIEILSVIAGSPAERSGLKAGDRIVSVNKKRVEGKPLAEVIKRIRGAAGTPVRVGVVRDGEELSFDMIRAKIEVPDTKVETRSGIAIVTVSQFGDHLIKDAPKIFDDIASSDDKGVIIDLRGNPGGYLNAVPAILSEFLPSGSTYLHTRSRTMVEEYVTSSEPSIPEDMPLVLLVDGNSASSAEIVAGALQDHHRATLVGEKTFGKGTVQTVYPFTNKATLKFTIAEWLTPDEHPINQVGVTPDVEVQAADAGDPALEKAIEIIRNAR